MRPLEVAEVEQGAAAGEGRRVLCGRSGVLLPFEEGVPPGDSEEAIGSPFRRE